MKVKVSILIPLYNAEAYIAEAVESALQQTYQNIEIIIVDDGSTDNSLSIARDYESDKVKVFSQLNKGASAARNKAFKLSSGELIQYLDADDILDTHKVEEQVKAFRDVQEQEAIINGRWGKYKESISTVKWEHQPIDRSYDIPLNWLLDSWNGGGMAQTGVWLVPRRLIAEAGPWREDLTLNDDGEFFTRVLIKAQKIVFVNKAKVFYRTDNYESLSKGKSYKAIKSQLHSLIYIGENLQEKLYVQQLREVMYQKMYNFLYLFGGAYPKLDKLALQYLESYSSHKKEPVLVSFKFRILVRLVGWNWVLSIRSSLNRLLR